MVAVDSGGNLTLIDTGDGAHSYLDSEVTFSMVSIMFSENYRGRYIDVTFKPYLGIGISPSEVAEHNFNKQIHSPLKKIVAKSTFEIPDTIKTLDSFGYAINNTYKNTVDFENGIYIQKVKAFILDGTEGEDTKDGYYFELGISGYVFSTSYCSHFKEDTENANPAKYNGYMYYGAGYLFETSAAALAKQYAEGDLVILLVRLAGDGIVTDISQLTNNIDNYIEVEPNKEVIFSNDRNIAVPSSITYMLKEV